MKNIRNDDTHNFFMLGRNSLRPYERFGMPEKLKEFNSKALDSKNRNGNSRHQK